MSRYLPDGVIHVKDLNLWAHVGVLDEERLLGQAFSLDFSLWIDLDYASKNDDLSSTADYSIAIRKIQKLSFELNCFTIEHFSERIIICLEELYGPVPMQVSLRKCNAPVSGFTGIVEVQRQRNWPT